MFKTATAKSEASRRHILETALALFRKRGFEATTMREIATAAGMALGAAYYYFQSKEAIVVAYYDQVQEEHERLTRAMLAGARDLRSRLRAAFRAKLEVIGKDRALLGALFRRIGDVKDPLGVFGPGTKTQREQSIATFAAALGDEPLPADLKPVAPTLVWFIHLGLIFYMLFDDSPGQRRTHKLAEAAADLFAGVLSLARLPGFGALRRRTLDALREAEVL
jgi:AcrR family transcriptional regulator